MQLVQILSEALLALSFRAVTLFFDLEVVIDGFGCSCAARALVWMASVVRSETLSMFRRV